MKPTLLAASPLNPLFVKALETKYTVIGPMAHDALMTHPDRESIQVIAAGGESKVPATMMDALPGLKLISVMGVGYDGVDVPHAIARGAMVTHTPNVLNDDVADLAIALMLNVTRRIPQAHQFVQAGEWAQGGLPLATKLSGLRLGIVGMGRIGQAIAHRAAAFGMPIAYTARSAKSNLPYAFVANVEDLAAQVDVLTLITPGGAGTHHMVNAAVLKALGPKGYVVNVARGSVIDEAALVEALQNGTIAGAGLDVFENEPHPLPALLTMDNVVLTPHVGSATDSTRQAMADLATTNIDRHFAGQALETPVPEC
ncbi:MAG: 2-hydroxyacid dehydrogenase [Burkholderiaceae bacterium]|jgi:lactate dehydrogenase-like 2-hydroxyacid dehydrogenase